MDDILQFIASYSDANEHRISFAWNGKHADEFQDTNYEFRKAVLDQLLLKPDDAPLILVRDLFRAETEWSREAWCVDNRIADLAQILLIRGKQEFLMDFLRGKHQSFDASMACGGIQIEPQLVEELLQEVEVRLRTSKDKIERQLLEAGKVIFTERIPQSQNKKAWWKFW
jgi:hypothetical protein